ncbi:MAG: hypothetical protein KF893_05705 [Caldilineaceae bacterium]|nr:hypothetical protein [Caldilineaceae bacterium]
MNNKAIGKIVKSNTHIDYVCQVYGPGEIMAQPQPMDYAFGEFVAIELASSPTDGSGTTLIGVIYNTLLLNPEFGNLGPRLSPRGEQEIFTPDYLNETAILVGIIAVGWRDPEGRWRQGVPNLAAEVDAPVRQLSDVELERFHRDDDGRLALRYAAVLLGMKNPLVTQLLINVIDRLVGIFPDQCGQLNVMRNNLAWKSIVQPAG